MFATFTSSMDSTSTANNTTPSSPVASRPKRSTVARACDWCRLNRIRCDNDQPCRNCRNRGVQCTKGRLSDQATSSAGSRELERLRSRVGGIEEQLRRRSGQEPAAPGAPPTPPETQDSHSVIFESSPRPQWHWPGVQVPDPRTSYPRYYGPSSLNYFIQRMSVYLCETCQQPQLADALQLCNNHRVAVTLGAALQKDLRADENMTRRQEEYLLGLFWQSYHSITPIVDQEELRTHYESLWMDADSSQFGQSRKFSPLIDIILALCMQYSAALIASGNLGSDFNVSDSNAGGQWLYHRCQLFLNSEEEAASISTLRCRIYSAIYLLNASCLDLCRSSLASAVDIAYALGLQHEPPAHLPQSQQSLRRRMWWTLLFLDSKINLELGRPYLISLSDVSVKLDDRPVDGSLTDDNISPLIYHAQCTKLAIRARTISAAVFAKAGHFMSLHAGNSSIHENEAVLGKCTSFLQQNMQSLQVLLKDVPPALKLARKGAGEPFSTAKTPLAIESYAPLWLQRQRVLLELLYHNLIMTIYRPFVKFPTTASVQTPRPSANGSTDGNALHALTHAVATVHIVHQVLTETDVLNSWNRAFQYTWDAVVTILGFTVVHPLCPYTFSARKAITLAIEAFGIFAGYGFSAASIAAATVKDISDLAQNTVKSFAFSLPSTSQGLSASPNTQAQQGGSLADSNIQSLQQRMPEFPSWVNSTPSDLRTTDSIYGDVSNLNLPSMNMEFSPEILSGFDHTWASWETSMRS